MGLIVKKDFPIGYNIECYLRIAKNTYDFKSKQWLIVCEFYMDEQSVKTKKIITYLKIWMRENPEKINNDVWDYLNKNYFLVNSNLSPIGIETINFDSLFTPRDFETDEEIFTLIYDQIKSNPYLVQIKSIIRDTIENDEDLIKPIIEEILLIFENSKEKIKE